MTSPLNLAIADLFPVESDDWVLSFSLKEPGRVLPSVVRWAERGPLRGFFHGLLFERNALADPIDGLQPEVSDAVLILRAYERGGEAALSRLRGSFVAAIVDRERDIVIIAHDPLGSHPLFYVESESSVSFAATPQTLLNRPGVSRSLNRAALADHLCLRWPDANETFFKAVRRVPSGWQAVISGGRVRLMRTWDPIPENKPIEWLTTEEANRFDDVFDRAVDRCLSNGPTGIFLSGGLDSISVAAVATDRARQIGQNLPLALSLGFTDPACDERVTQAAVARTLGLRQHLVNLDEAVGSRPLLEQALQMNRSSATPLQNAYSPAFISLVRRAKREGVRTILTGQGGDEWLAVTPFLSADLIRRGAFLELAQFFGTLWRSYQLRPLALARNLLWNCGLRPLGGMALYRLIPEAHDSGRLERLLAGDPKWVTPDRDLRAKQLHRATGILTPADPRQGFYVREIRTGLGHTLTAWEAEGHYELSKRNGIRILHPFWDPDLIEMLCRIPPRYLNAGGRSKSLVRQMLARRFPGLGLERQRKAHAISFFQSLLRREGPALANEAGDFPALSALGVVDGRATREFVLEGLKQPGPPPFRIWVVINLEMWVRFHSG